MQYVCTVNAQWLNKTVDNNFDPIYKVSSNKVYNEADLRMQNVDNLLKVYLAGEFWCTDNPIVELSFLVRGHREYYSITASVIGDFKNVLVISFDLEAENFFQDFKYCDELTSVHAAFILLMRRILPPQAQVKWCILFFCVCINN
jgi:hypothetical protein